MAGRPAPEFRFVPVRQIRDAHQNHMFSIYVTCNSLCPALRNQVVRSAHDRCFWTAMSSRRTIAFAVLILVTLFQIVRFVSQRSPSSYINGPSPGLFGMLKSPRVTITHPIPKLMADAEVKYRRLLDRQSRSFRGAVAEYRRRYKHDPPKGFDDWYAFAMTNNVKIIDEYDGMVDDLAPFWDLSGEEIRRRVLQVRPTLAGQ